MPVVLTIAGFDPCGGAGLQADLKTFQARGVYGLSVASAVTVQNTRGVAAVYPLPAAQVREQLACLRDDFDICALKIGMLASARIVGVVADFLAKSALELVVLDPIVHSQSGLRLNDDACLELMARELFPRSLLLTPNSEEASFFCRFPVDDLPAMRAAAACLQRSGAANVLIKGGHLPGKVGCDLFFDGSTYVLRRWRKLAGDSPHGTGCILSAAITAGLARGEPLPEAIAGARRYLAGLRRRRLRLGRGYPLLSPGLRAAAGVEDGP